MTHATKPDDKGWALIGASRKFHYYRGDSRSACGKFLAMFAPADAFEANDGSAVQSSGDCAACWKKLPLISDESTATAK